MAKAKAKPDTAPLDAAELDDFLLWFFTHTGHAEHVATWRATLDNPTPASPDAGAGDR